MSAKITYEPLAYCDDCAEGPEHGVDQREWADDHNREYHHKATS